jgi:TolB-like protein
LTKELVAKLVIAIIPFNDIVFGSFLYVLINGIEAMKNRRSTDHALQQTCVIHATTFGIFSLINQYNEFIPIKSRRAKTLIAMLCIAPGVPLEREFLSKLLWPGRFEAQAKASLRQSLLELSKILSPISNELLIITRSQISIDKTLVSTDFQVLEDAFSLKDCALAAELLAQIGTRDVLDDMSYGKQFTEWLAQHRLRIEQKLRTYLMLALSDVASDETNIELIALKEVAKIRQSKWNEVNAKPQAKIRIAILPFMTLSDRPKDYFADGMVDEIITMLGQVPELAVAGRSSSFALKGSERTLPEIAGILGVEHLLQGSVQRQGNNIRINIHLIDGATGFEKWGKRYSGNVDDIFALQESVAGDVTSELSVALNITIEVPKSSPLTTHIQAYGLYAQANTLLKRRVGSGLMEKVILLLEQALALDPNFAEAWTALAEANAYLIISISDGPNKSALIQRIAFCAKKAMSLAAKNGHAMVLLGIYKLIQKDPLGALDLAFKAHRIEPNNPEVTARLGALLGYCGLTKQSLPFIVAAAEQDPLDVRHLIHLTTALLNIGDIEGSQLAAYKLTKLGMLSLHLGVATYAAGDYELAVKHYQQSRLMTSALAAMLLSKSDMSEQELDEYWDTVSKGVCSGQAQDREKYCRLLDYMYATMENKYGSQIAIPAVWLGYAPMVFQTLGEQILPSTFPALQSIWADIEPIRQIRLHPDFMQFAQGIGLPKVWQKYGWPDLLAEPIV